MTEKWLIPTEKIPPPWDETVTWLNESKLPIINASSALELSLIAPQIEFWISALHWLYRKTWNSKHRIPGDRKTVQLSEPLGDLFIAIKELCKECHFLLGEEGTGYPCAAAWFACIAYEDRYWRVIAASARAKQTGRMGRTKLERTKPQAIKEARQGIIAPLRGRKPYNPFDPKQKHLHGLVNHAIKCSVISDQFCQNYWQPFIKGWQKWIKCIETNPEFAEHWVENGTIFVQNGRGRSKLKFQLEVKALKLLQEAGFTI